MKLLRLAYLLLAVLLLGCGSSTPNVAGTWTFTDTSTVGNGTSSGTGALSQSGGSVTGTIVEGSNSFSLSGTVNAAKAANFTLTATCFFGTATVALTGRVNSSDTMSGTYLESDSCT